MEEVLRSKIDKYGIVSTMIGEIVNLLEYELMLAVFRVRALTVVVSGLVLVDSKIYAYAWGAALNAQSLWFSILLMTIKKTGQWPVILFSAFAKWCLAPRA